MENIILIEDDIDEKSFTKQIKIDKTKYKELKVSLGITEFNTAL